jgi:hypothetical protein
MLAKTLFEERLKFECMHYFTYLGERDLNFKTCFKCTLTTFSSQIRLIPQRKRMRRAYILFMCAYVVLVHRCTVVKNQTNLNSIFERPFISVLTCLIISKPVLQASLCLLMILFKLLT